MRRLKRATTTHKKTIALKTDNAVAIFIRLIAAYSRKQVIDTRFSCPLALNTIKKTNPNELDKKLPEESNE